MTDHVINILFFSNQPVRGGVEEHMLMLIQSLDRARFRVHLMCDPRVLAQLRAEVPDDVVVHALYFERLTQFREAWKFARILREHRIDILHSHLFRASLVGSPLAWLCRVPVILETPHLRESWRSGWLKGQFVIDRLIGRFVNGYIAVSKANREYLVRTKRLCAANIHVIENGCRLQRFVPGHRPLRNLRQDLGLPSDSLIVVVLARLEEQKGHRVLIEAMQSVVRTVPKVRLVCVGEGSLRSQLEAQVEQAGLANCVRFTGYQSNAEDWLAMADIVALPSLFEGLPLAAIEALAAGKAVVASSVDGTPEVVVHELTGLTVPPGDPEALAGAICRLLADAPLRRELGQNGFRRVHERFSIETFVARTEALYLSAVESHRRTFERAGAPQATEAVPARRSLAK